MAAIDLTADEVRALVDAALARELFIHAQAQPGTPWDSSWFRSPDLQSAMDKLSEALAEQDGSTP